MDVKAIFPCVTSQKMSVCKVEALVIIMSIYEKFQPLPYVTFTLNF